MTAPEYALWDVCRSLSHQTGILFFNGRSVAGRFQSMAKSTAYNLADSLTEKGWFKVVKDSTRRRDGTFSPKQYQVLSHDDWVKEHPNQCSSPVQNEGLDEDLPVQLQNSPVQLQNSPVQPEGHNLISTTDKNQPIKPDYLIACPSNGLDGFVNRFSKRRKPRQSANAVAPTWTAQPVQPGGQATVIDTQAEADRLSAPIINTLGLKHPDEKLAWTTSIKSLLDSGHTPDRVQMAAEFAHTKFKPGTMAREGAAGFAQSFDLIAKAAMQHTAEKAMEVA